MDKILLNRCLMFMIIFLCGCAAFQHANANYEACMADVECKKMASEAGDNARSAAPVGLIGTAIGGIVSLGVGIWLGSKKAR